MIRIGNCTELPDVNKVNPAGDTVPPGKSINEGDGLGIAKLPYGKKAIANNEISNTDPFLDIWTFHEMTNPYGLKRRSRSVLRQQKIILFINVNANLLRLIYIHHILLLQYPGCSHELISR